MTQPAPYTRNYDFTAFQAANPAYPLLPTQGLESELNEIEAVFGAVLANLALIQQDDTRLKNEVVHMDAFDSGALGLMRGSWTPRGDWATATVYAVSDFVSVSGRLYVCIAAHTSGTFLTDRDANGYWMVVDNDVLQDYAIAVQTVTWAAAPAIDLTAGNTVDITRGAGTCTPTITGWPVSGREGKCTFYIAQGAGTFVWTSVVDKWIGGSAPTLGTTAGDVDIVIITTIDGGTTKLGVHVGTAA